MNDFIDTALGCIVGLGFIAFNVAVCMGLYACGRILALALDFAIGDAAERGASALIRCHDRRCRDASAETQGSQS
jgi:hypothetical protein